MKKNILLFGLHNACTSQVYKYLDDDIDIKVWIGKRGKCTHHIFKLYDLHIQKRTNKLTNDYQHRAEYVDIYESVLKHSNVFMYMYSRDYKLHGENSFLDMMDALHVFIHIFIDMVIENKVDHIFFANIPHEGADYVLYLVAKALKVRVHMFHQSQVPNKAYLTTDMNNVGSLNVDMTIPKVHIKKGSRKSPWYMAPEKKVNWWTKAFSALLLQWQIDKFFYRLSKARRTKYFNRDYSQLVSTDIPNEKFVYFAMHLQPELTTASWGKEFTDQILALECLRALLPEDWIIVAKENPKQSHHSRGRLFFQRLMRIPNLVYLGNSVNTFELISKSEFVSTITGTVGYEALTFGKKVVIFGDALYKDFPGVVKYNKNTALQDILDLSFTHKDIELAQARLEKNMVNVIVDCDYKVLVDDLDVQKNAKSLANIINRNTFRD